MSIVFDASSQTFLRKLRLKGLRPDWDYTVLESAEGSEPALFGGDELMGAGLNLPVWKGDFRSRLYRLRAENSTGGVVR
ncbi:GH36 C-terminal domain-containing protein [Paenibacillus filicis]|uniref:GH36 C-terminal domain-containing protein n=1 Tax=Paenibacillus gyeongsangnamensis TaxID=3388067 RepID=A0ABT4QBK5_9BACL|nr:GH36 C-terminal domain-containing protein [Paenibacillus filicis]MCZ8514205.1 GH36 C-terminal domain-containing protein [Paenibacillus filicis]